VKQLESEIEQLRGKLSRSEAARDKFSSKAAELDQELTGLRVANSLLEQQVDSLQGEVGVAELVQQDLGHVLKLVGEGVGGGEIKVGV
jgi:septal ring factor EnvC (AmiA/AmiB activator)